MIPTCKNIYPIEFSKKSAEEIHPVVDVTTDPLKHHVFTSILENNRVSDETKENNSKEIKIGEKKLLTEKKLNTKDVQRTIEESSNSQARPSLLKQYQGIKILVDQYLGIIKQRLLEEIASLNDVRQERKGIETTNVSIKTVLYLISTDWFDKWEAAVLQSKIAFEKKLSSIKIDNLSKNIPSLDNASLMSIETESLLDNIAEDINYVLLPKEAWEALKSWYSSSNCVGIPVQGKIDTDTLFNKSVKLIDENTLHISNTVLRARYNNILLELDLYPIKPFTEVDSYKFHEELLSSQYKNNNQTLTISKTIQMKSYIYQDSGYIANCILKCFICHENGKYRCSKCTAVHYCSQSCQKIHWKYHKNWCSQANIYKMLPPSEFQAIVSQGKRGKVGLMNLGNSCYMNSCLQCLSHISPLVGYVLSERYQLELNKENRDGTGGLLTNELFSLFKELWLDSRSYISPVGIKRVLGKLNSDYMGMQQHDAHEVTMLILDKLHEDLNRVHEKPYTINPEGDGSNDDAIAIEAWDKHLLRENSVIQELIGGLVRNEVNCLICNKTNIQFDYQQTIQLAIPKNDNRILYVLHVSIQSHDYNQLIYKPVRPQLYAITVDKLCTIQQLKTKLFSTYPFLLKKPNETSEEEPLELKLIESDKQNLLLKRFLHDNDSITTIKLGNYISLYHIDEKSVQLQQNRYIILLQVYPFFP